MTEKFDFEQALEALKAGRAASGDGVLDDCRYAIIS